MWEYHEQLQIERVGEDVKPGTSRYQILRLKQRDTADIIIPTS